MQAGPFVSQRLVNQDDVRRLGKRPDLTGRGNADDQLRALWAVHGPVGFVVIEAEMPTARIDLDEEEHVKPAQDRPDRGSDELVVPAYDQMADRRARCLIRVLAWVL